MNDLSELAKISPPCSVPNPGTCNGDTTLRIEAVHPVVALRSREVEIVADANVHGKLLVDFPVVLDESSCLEALRADQVRNLVTTARNSRTAIANEKTRQRIASAGERELDVPVKS